MQHTRVLGTIGLVAATALSAFGPSATSHAATTLNAQPTLKRVSNSVATARLQTALKKGYIVTARGMHVPLSGALRNFVVTGTASGHKKAAASGHADASLPGRQLSNTTQANQDYGYYSTGNGALFHNTESVAVDPLNAGHIVIGATDNRIGDQGASFNFGSNPSTSANSQSNPFNFGFCLEGQALVSGSVNLTCDLIEALGGPGIYNSIDGGANFGDLIIPDMLTGAVPNAIAPFMTPITPTIVLSGVVPFAAAAIVAPSVITGTQVACLSATVSFSNTFNVAGSPNACVPYDSVGDQTVSFDAAGNLYSSSLGIVNNPPYGTGVSLTPQTDIVINVSPAVQPIGASALQAVTSSYGFPLGPALVTPPMAAGRFFNAPPATTTCNVFQPDTQLCLHNEVVASNSPYNFINTTIQNTITFSGTAPYLSFGGSSTPISGNVSLTATIVGRNFQADANNPAVGAYGPGQCGFDTINGDICLIDSPYLTIDSVRNVAYLTYTVLDFNTNTSNIYLTSSLGLASPGSGVLPFWGAPVLVDNGFNNGYCTNAVSLPTNSCTASWGAQPAVGPDGTLYIAYENADLVPTSAIPFNQILVAWQYLNGPTLVQGTRQASATVYDHDAYTFTTCNAPNPPSSLFTTCDSFNYAALDAASGAYFTIPNRPSLAVTGPTASAPYGNVVVVYTTQGGASGLANGTRVDSVTLTPTNKGQFGFGLWSQGSPVDVAPTTSTVNQFFPSVAASQQVFPGTSALANKDNVFVGFYQETPGVVTISPDANISTSTARLTYYAARSSDFGATYGLTAVDTGLSLPNPPASAAYGDYLIGGFFSTSGATLSEFAALNAVPYFGTYTGAASDNGNGAYLSWTSTKANTHDFGVSGSQNVAVTHVG